MKYYSERFGWFIDSLGKLWMFSAFRGWFQVVVYGYPWHRGLNVKVGRLSFVVSYSTEETDAIPFDGIDGSNKDMHP